MKSGKSKIAALAVCTAIIVGLAVCLYPVAKLAWQIQSHQHQIKHDFDHAAIRASCMNLLVDPAERIVESKDLPEPIASTDPHDVFIKATLYQLSMEADFFITV